MPITIKQFPFDPTANKPSNLVNGELHTFGDEEIKVLIPRHGPVYSHTVRVYDRLTSTPIPDEKIKRLGMNATLTERVPHEVCSILAIEGYGPDSDKEVELRYQVVGGEFVDQSSVILDLVTNLLEDDRAVLWSKIKGKPLKFNPEKHFHHVDDFYGLQNYVAALKGVKEAIYVQDRAMHEEIMRRFDVEAAKVDEDIINARNVVMQALQAHMDDENNPHNQRKEHVGLNLAPNFPPATITATVEGIEDNTLVHPRGAKRAIEVVAVTQFNDHTIRTDNPHYTTAEQLDLGLVVNYPVATDEQSRLGVIDDAYITPYGVKLLVAHHALEPLAQHVNNVGNPHGTRKDDIGLDLAPNYPPATLAQARAGTHNESLLTPETAWAAIQTLFTDPITEHKANKNNPHGTTKFHLGLGEVDNFSRAYYDSRYAPTAHNHTYDTLPFDAVDVLRWNQTKSDLETVAPFDPAGNYPNVRAGATTAEDVGLGEAPNWSEAEFMSRFAAKDHDHSEYITPSQADSRYAPKGSFDPVIRYARDYSVWALETYILGENPTEPSPP